MKKFESNALQQELARSQVPGVHPDADVLTSFAEGTLLAHERTEVVAHLAACAGCRETVSVAVSAAPETAAMGPQLVPKRVGQVLRSWMPWMGIAAVVTVVATAVVVHRRTAAPNPGGNEVAIVEQKPSVPTPAASPTVLPEQPQSVHPEPVARARREASTATPAQPVAAAPPLAPVVPLPRMLGRANATAATPSASPMSQQDKFHGAVNEAVNVDGNSAQLDTEAAQAADQVVLGANAPALEKTSPGVAKSMSPFSAGVAGAMAAPKRMTKADVRPQWRINEEGHAERSFGDDVWHAVLANETSRMRVVATVGNDVWVGGEDQRLFHSSDSGSTWTPIALPAGDKTLHAITHIRFTSTQTGTVGADDGTLWTTTDGGATWH